MDYRAMRALADNPARVRSEAVAILNILGPSLSDRAEEFLVSLSNYDGSPELSTRKLEYLYSLRERSTRRPQVGKYRAASLVKKVYEAKLDLQNYEDEQWIDTLHLQAEQVLLSNNEWRRLFALCRELGLIEDEWISLQ